MCGDVVGLGSQRLPVPVFSFSQLVQSNVGLSCEEQSEGSSQGSKCQGAGHRTSVPIVLVDQTRFQWAAQVNTYPNVLFIG